MLYAMTDLIGLCKFFFLNLTNQKSSFLSLFLLVSLKNVNSYWLNLLWFGLVETNYLEINFVISDILNLKMAAVIPINGR